MYRDAMSQSISRYVSGALLDLSTDFAEDTELPSLEVHSGALLLTDISGWTGLTTLLASQGSAGIERASRLLNDFFADLIELVESQGGILFSFAGDSLLAGWPVDSTCPTLEDATWRCCGCAIAIKERFSKRSIDERELRVRVSVGAGEIRFIHVGDPTRRWYFFTDGAAFAQVSSSGTQADAGEILVSREAWDQVAHHCEGERKSSSAVRLKQVLPRLDPEPSPHPRRPIKEGARDLHAYLPKALLERLRSPLPTWLGELRAVTVCFLHLIDQAGDAELLRANSLVLRVLEIVERLKGDLLQIETTERGLNLLIVFGLPGEAHEDDPRRASMAALEVQASAADAHWGISGGITTGQVFCGVIGGEHFAEYRVLGDVVNLAARFATLAAGRIMADEETATAAQNMIRCEGPWPVQIPGIRKALKVYIPVAPDKVAGTAMPTRIIDRERELRFLVDRLRGIGPSDRKIVTIFGEPGIGKTALVGTLVHESRQLGIPVFEGHADALEQATAYYIWLDIVRSALRIESSPSSQSEEESVIGCLSAAGELADFAPLLNDVLSIHITDNALTAELSSQLRAKKLRQLLAWVVTQTLGKGPTLLILEDAHWMDRASINLLEDILMSASGLMVVLTSRDLVASAAGEHLSARLRRIHIPLSLDRLNEIDSLDLVRRYLPAKPMLDFLEGLVVNSCGGNPLFIGELCRVIEQTDFRQTAGHAASNVTSLIWPPPKSVESVVLSRIDNLPAESRVLIKIASVAAPQLSVAELQSLRPVQSAAIDVPAAIEQLVSRHLLQALEEHPEHYQFCHAIIRDVVYESMLTTQRREAHAAVAGALESKHGADPVSLPLILHHWRGADETRKIMEYLDRVAELKLKQYDNQAAIALIKELFSLAKSSGLKLAVEREAKCELILAEAAKSVGQMENARRSYERGLTLLGMPVPTSTLGLVLFLARESLTLGWTRLSSRNLSSGSKTASSADREHFLAAARAHDALTQIYYFTGEKSRLLHSTLRATNLAERFGEITPTLAVNYASLGAICGVIPLRRTAEYYIARATAIVDRFPDPAPSIHVHLLAGLYATAVGEWSRAQQEFEAGIELARTIGDQRRWAELAVGLETVSGPWLLTTSFMGVDPWQSLVKQICATGKRQSDFQVLACGLLGAVRGSLVLRTYEKEEEEQLAELAQLVDEHAAELEPIHCVEAAGLLATAAVHRGDPDAWSAWLRRGQSFLRNVNPGMKSRTLPALVALFDACIKSSAEKPNPGPIPDQGIQVARDLIKKLSHFARIYPIGRPAALRCKGDLQVACAIKDRGIRCWRSSLRKALELRMPRDAIAAFSRLSDTRPVDQEAASELEALLQEKKTRWNEVIQAIRTHGAAGSIGPDSTRR